MKKGERLLRLSAKVPFGILKRGESRWRSVHSTLLDASKALKKLDTDHPDLIFCLFRFNPSQNTAWPYPPETL